MPWLKPARLSETLPGLPQLAPTNVAARWRGRRPMDAFGRLSRSHILDALALLSLLSSAITWLVDRRRSAPPSPFYARLWQWLKAITQGSYLAAVVAVLGVALLRTFTDRESDPWPFLRTQPQPE